MPRTDEFTLEQDKPKKEKPGLLSRLYRAFKPDEDAGLATIQGGYGDTQGRGLFGTRNDSNLDDPDAEKLLYEFPTDRFAQYPILEEMIKDPLNEAAVTMHIYQALSSKTDTGEIVFIEPKDGAGNDKIVQDLRDTFSQTLNFNLIKWGFLASLYGYFPLRVYGEQGKGVNLIRDDYYMNPRFIREYRRAGELAGFTHRYQNGNGDNGLNRLIEPWKFVTISMQQYTMPGIVEPMRLNLFDIEREDWWNDEPIETISYGNSIMSTAYLPWMDFNDSLLSLSISRRNAAKRDRFITVNTGKSHPVQAAKYYNAMAEQLQRKAKESAKRSLARGYVSTIDNHVFPIWSNGTGQVNIQTEDSPVDVSAIEDVMMHLNRLCAAHGLDKSLLGWGDSMSGGLGEGGFFRTAITAAMRANQIRQAVLPALDRLFEIHVAYKYGKVFTPAEKPWKITFNSLNTAIQYEEAEAQEKAAAYATSVATLMQMLDPEMSKFKFEESSDYLMRDILKMDADTLKKMIVKGANKQPPVGFGEPPMQGDGNNQNQEDDQSNQAVNDSLGSISEGDMRKLILDILQGN